MISFELNQKRYTMRNFILILLVPLFTMCKSASVGSSKRDGSSFKKAIIVQSISEEYQYVRQVCPTCQVTSQALVFEKKKPYDILYAKDGVVDKKFIFDISSFYGKGF